MAAFFGILGQGTLRITGLAPGPSNVATLIAFGFFRFGVVIFPAGYAQSPTLCALREQSWAWGRYSGSNRGTGEHRISSLTPAAIFVVVLISCSRRYGRLEPDQGDPRSNGGSP